MDIHFQALYCLNSPVTSAVFKMSYLNCQPFKLSKDENVCEVWFLMCFHSLDKTTVRSHFLCFFGLFLFFSLFFVTCVKLLKRSLYKHFSSDWWGQFVFLGHSQAVCSYCKQQARHAWVCMLVSQLDKEVNSFRFVNSRYSAELGVKRRRMNRKDSQVHSHKHI